MGKATTDHHEHCRYWRHIQQRNSIRRHNERCVLKSGEFNVEKPHIPIFSNIMNKFIEARWKWSILFCVVIYISMWLAFAGVWWIILYLHGDLDEEHLPYTSNTEWKPCVREIYSFTSILLFSIEIHTTIGYGKRAITLECPTAMLTMCIESIAGHITQSLIIGIVFAKLTRPKNRANTLLFSKNAIINQRDGNLCLLFRVGNIRKSRIISSKIKAYLIRYERKTDGNILNSEQIELDLKVDASDDIHFIFPTSAIHKINENSPFYDMSAKMMLGLNIEILVVFEGIIESTGQPVQAISSYTTQEILWGHRFVQSSYFSRRKQGFIKDFTKFDETYKVNTPLCRARDLEKFYEKRKKLLSKNYQFYLRDLITISQSVLVESY